MNYDNNIELLNDYVYDVKCCLLNTAAGACKLGYCLIQIRELELYKFSDYYKKFCPEEYSTDCNRLKFTKYTFYNYCKDAFHFSRRSVDRFISICLEFSEKTEIGDVTEKIDTDYETYSTSALAEMLNLSECQREKCSPDMGVKEIRDIKNMLQDIAQLQNDNVVSESETEKDFLNESASAPDAVVLPEVKIDNGNWNDTVPVESVNIDDVPLMKSRTYKKKKYLLASDDYDCFVDTVSSFTSSFSTVSGYLNKGYLLRLVLYKPE